MDSLKLLDFSSFIIFSDDPWSLLVSFCQLFKLPLVVQCCNVICEWPLIWELPSHSSLVPGLRRAEPHMLSVGVVVVVKRLKCCGRPRLENTQLLSPAPAKFSLGSLAGSLVPRLTF